MRMRERASGHLYIRDLGGAALRLPDGGGAAEPARDGRGHHHRALGRRRPPRRHGRRGQGPVAGT